MKCFVVSFSCSGNEAVRGVKFSGNGSVYGKRSVTLGSQVLFTNSLCAGYSVKLRKAKKSIIIFFLALFRRDISQKCLFFRNFINLQWLFRLNSNKVGMQTAVYVTTCGYDLWLVQHKTVKLLLWICIADLSYFVLNN